MNKLYFKREPNTANVYLRWNDKYAAISASTRETTYDIAKRAMSVLFSGIHRNNYEDLSVTPVQVDLSILDFTFNPTVNEEFNTEPKLAVTLPSDTIIAFAKRMFEAGQRNKDKSFEEYCINTSVDYILSK